MIYLTRSGEKNYFTKLILISWCYKVRIKEEDFYKKPFCTPYGHYEFVVVLFGLTNVLATFICFMNSVLPPYLDTFVIVFIDDMLA